MAKMIVPDNIQIKSLNQQRSAQQRDPMSPGSGTAWEDAGAQGYVTSFFKTAWQMMLNPSKLLWQMRRPDATGDATGFVIGCIVMWVLSVLIHSILWLYVPALPRPDSLSYQPVHGHTIEVDSSQWWINTALVAAVAGALVWVLWKLVTLMYYKLTAFDMKPPSPPVLTANVLGYAMAPSILAVIPLAGPILALIWVPVLWLFGGVARLRLKATASIIGTVLSLVAVVVLVGVGAWLLKFIWIDVFGYPGITDNPILTNNQ